MILLDQFLYTASLIIFIMTKKGEELDYEKASRLLLEEFRSGKLGKVTLEFPKGPEEV